MSTIERSTRFPEIEIEVDPQRAEFEAAQRRPIELASAELTFGFVFLLIWFSLFTGGLLVDTEPYRTAIQTPLGIWNAIGSGLIVIVCWTVTNVGLLSCVAACLGALGRRTRFTNQVDLSRPAIDATRDTHERLATYYLSSVLRGFGVYTLILGGLLVLATSALISPEQGDYMRLAPTVSIISFYAGYDAKVFSGLLDRVNIFLRPKSS